MKRQLQSGALPLATVQRRVVRQLLALVGVAFSVLFLAVRVMAEEASHGGDQGESLVHGSPWLYVAMSWIAIVFLVLLGALGTRRLQQVPGQLQNFLEMVVGGLEQFFLDVLGPEGKRHVPILVTFFLYILVMNLMGLIPFMKPATSTLNMTVALSLVAIIYVQIQGIRENGFLGYVKHFLGEPLWLAPLMFILHVIGEIAKPLSLSIRLFGNVFGEETVVLQLALLGPLAIGVYKLLPIQFPMFVFGLFTSVVQALVFAILVAAYIVLMTAHEDHDEHSSGEAHETSAQWSGAA
ncbi:MAG: F0F1 ATP synthase subunit A [Armatimonadetes bacterium]|nr:F0F1 ATP synthase subunit A [Armatimonadota bacterium]